MFSKDQGQKNHVEVFQMLHGNTKLLAKVIDCLPYPVQVYAPDGTSVLVNKAMLAEYHVDDPEIIVRKYNVLKDPSVIATGRYEALKRAFRGEIVYLYDIRVPIEDIMERYSIRDLDIIAAYQDITLFPLRRTEKCSICRCVMIDRRVYRGKEELEKAKEDMDTHWLEPFDADATAKAACLSRAHFSRLFKKHTGTTPYEYYINYKIYKLREKLLDPNLTIKQAFDLCNMDYSGNSARLFRQKTGFSPSPTADGARR